jgi:hypothetical protein
MWLRLDRTVGVLKAAVDIVAITTFTDDPTHLVSQIHCRLHTRCKDMIATGS